MYPAPLLNKLRSLTLRYVSGRERFPHSFVLLVHRVRIPCPVLHLVHTCVGLSPDDPYRVNPMLFTEVDHNPLRMK